MIKGGFWSNFLWRRTSRQVNSPPPHLWTGVRVGRGARRGRWLFTQRSQHHCPSTYFWRWKQCSEHADGICLVQPQCTSQRRSRAERHAPAIRLAHAPLPESAHFDLLPMRRHGETGVRDKTASPQESLEQNPTSVSVLRRSWLFIMGAARILPIRPVALPPDSTCVLQLMFQLACSLCKATRISVHWIFLRYRL